MTLASFFGIVGAAIILILFILNQSNKLKNDNIYYDTFNFVGSVMLMIFAIMTNSLPFIILNFVWALFSAKDIVAKFLKNKKIKLTV